MHKLFIKTASLALSLTLLVSFAASAHEGHEHPEKGEIKQDLDFTPAFKEGTPNLLSASTLPGDSTYFLFSHQYFLSSFPRGSNPNFNLSYSPINNLQLDGIVALRDVTEYEVGARYQIFNEFKGDWLSLTPRLAYNSRGNIFGADLSASKFIFKDIWQVGLNYSFLSNGSSDKIDRIVNGLGVNTIVRVWKHWHLFGDVVVPLDGELLSQRSLLWSAGIKKRIPWTPHILTLYIGSNQQQTISGRVVSSNVLGSGASWTDFLKVGFTFSIFIPEISRMPERLF